MQNVQAPSCGPYHGLRQTIIVSVRSLPLVLFMTIMTGMVNSVHAAPATIDDVTSINPTIPTTPVIPITPPVIILPPIINLDPGVVEAEDQPGGLPLMTYRNGHKGSGFVELAEGSKITFTINVPTTNSGLNQLELRYGLPAGITSADAQVFVDGVRAVRHLHLPAAVLGPWGLASAHIKLNPGERKIAIRMQGRKTGRTALLLDRIRVTMTPPDQNRFLEFSTRVNAHVFAEGDVNTTVYYQTVDPTDARSTFSKFKSANFLTFIDENASDTARAIYQNVADLDLGRDMVVKKRPNGDVVSYVQNYPSVEDAIARRNLLATVAMEYRRIGTDTERSTIFYVYNARGQRINSIDLDGRGKKAVPTLCNACHGGKPKSLKRLSGGKKEYYDNGDTGAKWIPWDLDNFKFAANKSKASQEQQFRKMNQFVLCTDPGAANIELIQGWYGDNAASCNAIATNNFNGSYVPPGWSNTNDEISLYRNVVAPSCRTCHAQRGTYSANGTTVRQDDLEFRSFSDFASYKNDIERLVFDEGTMPGAKVTYNRFWRSSQPQTLDRVLFGGKAHSNPSLLKYPTRFKADFGDKRRPGRPIARLAVVDRAKRNTNVRANSLPSAFGDSVSWRTTAAGVTRALRGGKLANYRPRTSGMHTISLSVGNAYTRQRSSSSYTLRVFDSWPNTEFSDSDGAGSDVYSIISKCQSCHMKGLAADSIFHLKEPGSGLAMDSFNRFFSYSRSVSRMDCRDPLRSLIMLKPRNFHHAGGLVTTTTEYNVMKRWALEGAIFSNNNPPLTTPATACEEDFDNDGVLDHDDNCPLNANSNQRDQDGDRIGDRCEADGDRDGVINDLDNCRLVRNNSQADADRDGIGDVCEPDTDSDGHIDDEDNCPLILNTDQKDDDRDGTGNACDTDGDNDGIEDTVDNCPAARNAGQADSDGDGTGDACDPDSADQLLTSDKAAEILDKRTSCRGRRLARSEAGNNRSYSRSCMQWAADTSGINRSVATRYYRIKRDAGQLSLSQRYATAEINVFESRAACVVSRKEREATDGPRNYSRTCLKVAADVVAGINRPDARTSFTRARPTLPARLQ